CLKKERSFGPAFLPALSTSSRSVELLSGCAALCPCGSFQEQSNRKAAVLAVKQEAQAAVCSTDLVSLSVSKLALDHVRRKSMLVQDCARRAAEAVARGAGVITHAIKAIQDRVLAHESGWLVLVR